MESLKKELLARQERLNEEWFEKCVSAENSLTAKLDKIVVRIAADYNNPENWDGHVFKTAAAIDRRLEYSSFDWAPVFKSLEKRLAAHGLPGEDWQWDFRGNLIIVKRFTCHRELPDKVRADLLFKSIIIDNYALDPLIEQIIKDLNEPRNWRFYYVGKANPAARFDRAYNITKGQKEILAELKRRAPALCMEYYGNTLRAHATFLPSETKKFVPSVTDFIYS